MKQRGHAAARGSRVVGALVAGALLLAGCAQGTLAQTPQADLRPLLEAIEASATRSVSLGEVYGQAQDFDRAVAICPYMDPDDVVRALGFEWEAAAALPLQREGRGGLLLARDAGVVATLLVDRTELDFCSTPDAAGARIEPGRVLGFTPGPGPTWDAGWNGMLR